ncbi:MAG TPA: S1/P1 nuclease [Ferruginibacter sp.]|nr:S1/P1 nuclease [Ferruginibacter sp.]
MIKYIFALLLFCNVCFPIRSFAWGPEGHAIVGRLAMRFVNADVKENIYRLLGNMPVDTAANWMDIIKSNADYDFMRSWHYVDFPKGQQYVTTNNDNIINRLILSYNELQHKKLLCEDQVRTDLLILMHLMGDLHNPLHTGYDDDLGGNKVTIQYDTIKTHNLHRFWDEDIIDLTKITDNDCLQYYDINLADTLRNVDFIGWMYDSRSMLDAVYDFPGFMLDEKYLQTNKIVVQKQLLKAGVRLAFILNKLFYNPAPDIDFTTITAEYKNGINVNDAEKNLGKKVTVCSRVFSIRSTDAITQISIGKKFPNNPLTIIIFGKNYSRFNKPLTEMFTDKNICIKGTITEYKGKPQIIIDDPDDIKIQ